MKIVITGGIGCGKSTALEILKANGISCLSADTIVQSLLSEDHTVINSVIEHFGEGLKNNDGTVNRSALAKIVFGSDSELEWLESLLHPLVQNSFEAFFQVNNGRLAFSEIPLLFEKRLEKKYDLVVSVISSESNTNFRLRGRGYSERDIESRRRLQLPNSIKAVKSNFVLSNDGSLKFLEQQIITLLSTLKQ